MVISCSIKTIVYRPLCIVCIVPCDLCKYATAVKHIEHSRTIVVVTVVLRVAVAVVNVCFDVDVIVVSICTPAFGFHGSNVTSRYGKIAVIET